MLREHSTDRLEAGLEKAQLFGLVNETQTRNFIAPLIQADDPVGYGAHVIVGIDAPRNGQTDELERRSVVLPGLRVTVL